MAKRPREPAPTPEQIDWIARVRAAAAGTPSEYFAFLKTYLVASSRIPWHSVSLAAAFHGLSECKGGIPSQPDLVDFLDLLTSRLSSNKGTLDSASVAQVFNGLSAFRTRSLDSNERAALEHLIRTIAGKVTPEQFHEAVTAQHVGMAFYGLHNIRTIDLDEAGRAAVVAALVTLGNYARALSETLGGQAIGMAFYGLQGIRTADLDDAGHLAVARVLKLLAEEVRKSPAELSAQSIGMAFLGLSNFDTAFFSEKGCKALTKAIEALADKLRFSKDWLGSEVIGQICDGLSGIDSSVLTRQGKAVAAKTLATLVERIAKQGEGFSAEDVARIIATLRMIDTAGLSISDRSYVTRIIQGLAAVSERLITPLEPQSIANAFCGLRGFETRFLEVPGRQALVKVIRSLTAATHICSDSFAARHVSMAFGGLQGINPDHLDAHGRGVVAETADALAAKARMSNEMLDAGQCARALIGIRGLLAAENTRSHAVEAARILVSKLSHPFSTPEEARSLAAALRMVHCVKDDLASEISTLWRHVDAFWQSFKMPGSSGVTEGFLLALNENQQVYGLYGRPMPAGLDEALADHKDQIAGLYSPTDKESAFRNALEEVLCVPVAVNELVHGFELDLCFTLDGRRYNVELDGRTHHKLNKRLNDVQRDAFLSSRGYEVIRYSSAISTQKVAAKVLAHVTRAPQDAASVAETSSPTASRDD